MQNLHNLEMDEISFDLLGKKTPSAIAAGCVGASLGLSQCRVGFRP